MVIAVVFRFYTRNSGGTTRRRRWHIVHGNGPHGEMAYIQYMRYVEPFMRANVSCRVFRVALVFFSVLQCLWLKHVKRNVRLIAIKRWWRITLYMCRYIWILSRLRFVFIHHRVFGTVALGQRMQIVCTGGTTYCYVSEE